MTLVTHELLRVFTFSIVKVTGIPHVTCTHTQTNKHTHLLIVSQPSVSGKTLHLLYL